METQYQYIETGGVPVKAWTRGVPLEDAARKQVENVAKLPFVHKHIASCRTCIGAWAPRSPV